ncbi:CoxG family protein [Oceanobacillus massiliensis]|uniref:CoxG family protein n=1 Tax=Oceanobacillus massiliensis TaxID=1465765 RepID=UPI0002897BD3|nr:SRPBCC family protein [Oceanobacillus massiliensis]
MAHSIHQMELDIPINIIWKFISDINNWAILVPGYADHKLINDRKSIWKLRGDFGIMQRTVKLEVNITESRKPSNIQFHLSGLNQTCTGEGYFQATEISKTKTTITGSLAITVKGRMGPVINPFLKTVVPKMTKDLTEKVASRIVETETVRATV